MRQVIQPINGGPTEVAEVPTPVCGQRQVLIANRFSLVSAGTERHTIHLARSTLLAKARQRPDQVRRVFRKIRREGLGATMRQVRARLDQPIPLGYSSAGVVIDVGAEVQEFRVGDRVASNGPHAGVVAVGKNLVAHVPDEVTLDRACYAVVGSIGLNAVRLAGVGVGDVVGVVGLGLLGQLTVAIAKSAGCIVVGTDPDPRRRDLALRMGVDAVGSAREFLAAVANRTGGLGADAVLIAAATSSNGPLELATRGARGKARIIAVGAVGLNVPRREFYRKELELVVARSYGPGRYDADYEEAGHDYPAEHVRWTEQRNIATVLRLIAAGRLPVEHLTTDRFGIDDAVSAYRSIEAQPAASVGILLTYPEQADRSQRVAIATGPRSAPASRAARGNAKRIGLSVVGAGSFAAGTLVPAFLHTKAFTRQGVVSASGLSARTLARKHRFRFAGTGIDEALFDEPTDAVLVATRHHRHVEMGLTTLRAGKNLFLEKPLAISDDQLDEWIGGIDELGPVCPVWTVGFNRRFAPATRLVREAFADAEGPKTLTIRMNAGRLAPDHWTLDPETGGGRIVGEACHAIDLATFLVGSRPIRVHAVATAPDGSPRPAQHDATIVLRHADGSVSTILYACTGDPAAGKERVEIFGADQTAFIDDYRSVLVHGDGHRLLRRRWWSPRKGHVEQATAFAAAVHTGIPPIPYADLLSVTAASLRAVRSIDLELPLDIPGFEEPTNRAPSSSLEPAAAGTNR